MHKEKPKFAIEPLANTKLEVCPLCKRELIHHNDHHLVPKSMGGKDVLDCCRDCHKAIHAMLPHKELKRYYHTVDRLLEHELLKKMIDWIAKQAPTSTISVQRPNDQKHRSKYR